MQSKNVCVKTKLVPHFILQRQLSVTRAIGINLCNGVVVTQYPLPHSNVLRRTEASSSSTVYLKLFELNATLILKIKSGLKAIPIHCCNPICSTRQ